MLKDNDNAAVWDAQALLEPDLILPDQLRQDPEIRQNKGELGLLWAVFTDGVQSYCREVLEGSTKSLSFLDVECWIFRPDSDALTSFSNLCSVFELDARKLRRGLLRFRDRPSPEVMTFFQAA